MPKRHYYCFVSGLADLIFDSSKSIPDLHEFREELKNNLHPTDYNLASLLFLPSDNRNLLTFLEGRDDAWDFPGTYTRDDFAGQLRIFQSILKEKNILPDYMVRLMEEWISTENGIASGIARKKLTEGYISLALESGNRFLEKWIRFDTDLNNIFIFLNAKSLNMDAGKYLIGNDLFANELLEIFKTGKDFIIPSEPDYASHIFKIATENEFLEREMKTDIARWDYIDSINFFEYFTIDLIIGYLIKYFIVLRWERLNPEKGKMMLRKFIDDMESKVLSTNLNES